MTPASLRQRGFWRGGRKNTWPIRLEYPSQPLPIWKTKAAAICAPIRALLAPLSAPVSFSTVAASESPNRKPNMGHDPQLKDLCERVLDLFDGLSVSDYRAAGMMLLSVAAFKMQ